MPGFANSVELAFDDHLGRDAGMIGSRLPQGSAPGHPVVSDQGIHDGVLKGMSHMQAAGDIWRGDRNGKGGPIPGRLECALGFPPLVQGTLYGVRVIGFAECFCTHSGVCQYWNKRIRFKPQEYRATGSEPKADSGPLEIRRRSTMERVDP